MDVFLGLLINVLEEGFIYGVMAMGVYITYQVLGFPDLSVDGTFPLGACVTAALLLAGVDPWVACLLAFLAGSFVGSITGLLHVKLHITDLLSGILVMTALWSVNLVITGGAARAFYNMPTVFSSGAAALLPQVLVPYRVVLVALFFVAVVKVLLDFYLKTKSGLMLRAAGNNPQYVLSLGHDPGRMKILGLAIGNGCTALSGAILAQQNETANIYSGTGMVVMALASVIIGINVLKKVKWMKPTAMVVIGAILYKASLVAAMQAGLPTEYLKLLMAVLFTAALVSSRIPGRRKHAHVNPTKI